MACWSLVAPLPIGAFHHKWTSKQQRSIGHISNSPQPTTPCPSWPCRRVVVLLLQAWASLVFLWVVWTWTTASPLSLIYSVPPSSIPPPSPSDSAPLPCPSATPQPSVLSTNTTPPLLPTWSQLDGFSRWGSCDYLSRPTCTGPYLHLLVPHSGRPKNLARLVRSFGPHTHPAEEVACTCLLVADVIVPVGRDVASAGLGDDDNDPVREGMQSWPGPHTLLRWRGKFSKVIAMDQLLNTITTPPNKTIAFVLDVDLVVKNGSFSFPFVLKHSSVICSHFHNLLRHCTRDHRQAPK